MGKEGKGETGVYIFPGLLVSFPACFLCAGLEPCLFAMGGDGLTADAVE